MLGHPATIRLWETCCDQLGHHLMMHPGELSQLVRGLRDVAIHRVSDTILQQRLDLTPWNFKIKKFYNNSDRQKRLNLSPIYIYKKLSWNAIDNNQTWKIAEWTFATHIIGSLPAALSSRITSSIALMSSFLESNFNTRIDDLKRACITDLFQLKIEETLRLKVVNADQEKLPW